MDLTHGEFVGTPSFASPELGGGSVDWSRAARSGLRSPVWHHTLARPWTRFAIYKTRDRLPVSQLIARKVPEPLVKLLRSTLAIDPAGSGPGRLAN